MSRVLSIRFQDQQVERLGRISRRLGKRPSETVALLVEEALRMSEHPYIDFRDSMAGRQAYVKGSGLAVWEVAMVARDYGGDVEKVAAHFRWPRTWVQAALHYARDYHDEIEKALADNDAVDFAAMQRLLPQTQLISVDDDASSGEKV
jgi:uncharacterized protein (DUF433 family)